MNTVLKDKKPLKKSELIVGDSVQVISFGGWVTLYVDSIDNDHATLYSKNRKYGTWIRVEDGYWQVMAGFDPEAIAKIELV